MPLRLLSPVLFPFWWLIAFQKHDTLRLMKSFTFQGIIVLFARDWWRTREWSAFWFGLPAVVVGLGILSLFAFAELSSPLERSREYLMAARQSQVLEKFEAADIFYKKALLENPDDLEALLESAALADQLEDPTRRDAILARLADEERDPAGMLFRAHVLLRQSGSDEAVNKARSLMQEALAKVSDDAQEAEAFVGHLDELRRNLARVSLVRQDFQGAVKSWKAIQEPVWEDRVDLGITHLALKQLDEAKTIAIALLQEAPVPTDGPSHAQRAVVLALAGDETEAFRQLYQSRLSMQSEAEWTGWAEMSIRCFHILRMSAPGLPNLKWLEQALAVSPVLPSLANELLITSGLGPENDFGEMESADLVEAVAGGEVPVVAHLLMGLVTLQNGDVPGSAVHFSISREFYPSTGLVLAQCGLLLVRRGEEFYEMATRLGELGVRFMKGHVGTSIGHARILMHAGSWDEAIRWLEPLSAEHEKLIAPLLERAQERWLEDESELEAPDPLPETENPESMQD